MRTASVLWKRLDCPGHEACRLVMRGDRPRLEGYAAWADEAGVASVVYSIDADGDWHTRAARVTGWAGETEIDIIVSREAQGWRIDGAPQPAFDGLHDIDLGFTPSTNTLAIRRLALGIGEEADTEALWLDTDDWTFKRLPQSYRRTGAQTYLYRSPSHAYEAVLTVDADGIVRDYPGLWSRAAGGTD